MSKATFNPYNIALYELYSGRSTFKSEHVAAQSQPQLKAKI